MNGRRVLTCSSVAYVVLSLLSTPVAFAQTGVAATKQMQDTQRKAHQKARESKSNARQSTDVPDEKNAKPASEAQ